MSTGALTHDELESLYNCISYGRMGNGILFACATLFLFDFSLTFYDELRFIWKPRRITLTSVSFLLSRYPILATTILILLPSYTIQEGNETVLLSQIAIVDPAYAAYPECRALISTVRDAYVVPYVLTIVYESVTLSLSLIRITRLRRRVRKTARAPLLDTLWRDGVFYFSWTLMLGFLNIALAVQSTSSQVRVGGSQLQAIIHSILSCRIVLHLAGSRFHNASIH
ncbi:hypothetical protein ARMSODRAFT_793164 [Armillaria solidipes]|uniref:DUF6533 domain-containing protein n=1 Tax=Armillaria solidipes TaxID=1076256 RepID=A0A2H3BLW3_9AGAR|nr:hypothetical protein ARMSODRAFT_793164 [Armillaria solidipes]